MKQKYLYVWMYVGMHEWMYGWTHQESGSLCAFLSERLQNELRLLDESLSCARHEDSSMRR